MPTWLGEYTTPNNASREATQNWENTTYENPIESRVVQSQGGLLYGSPCDHRIRARCAPQKQGA